MPHKIKRASLGTIIAWSEKRYMRINGLRMLLPRVRNKGNNVYAYSANKIQLAEAQSSSYSGLLTASNLKWTSHMYGKYSLLFVCTRRYFVCEYRLRKSQYSGTPSCVIEHLLDHFSNTTVLSGTYPDQQKHMQNLKKRKGEHLPTGIVWNILLANDVRSLFRVAGRKNKGFSNVFSVMWHLL